MPRSTSDRACSAVASTRTSPWSSKSVTRATPTPWNGAAIALQGIEPRVHGEREVRALDLDAPTVGGVDPKAHVAQVVLVDGEPVPAGREHPREREVGRVGPVADPPRGHRVGQEGVLVGLVRALADVVLDDTAVEADRMGSLTEPEEPLLVPGDEALSDDRRTVDADRDRDRLVAGRPNVHLRRHAVGVVGVEHRREPLRGPTPG